MYDKQDATFRNLPIAGVAQSSSFYLPKDEAALSSEVEGPALAPLNKLRQGAVITAEERASIAIYMQFLLVRVPKHRKNVPSMLEEVIPEESKRLESALRAAGWANEEGFRALRSLQEGDFSLLSPEMMDALEKQQRLLPEVVRHLYGMSWQVMFARSEDYFFTSDNPMYYSDGLEKPHCEVAFPLSSEATLFASWAGEPASLAFLEAKASHVGKVNEATRHWADRFLFSRQKDRRLKALRPTSLRDLRGTGGWR